MSLLLPGGTSDSGQRPDDECRRREQEHGVERADDRRRASVPTSAIAVSTRSGSRPFWPPRSRTARTNRPNMTASSRTKPTTPRSDRNATQSLLGHGLDVIPSSCESDGSFFDANFGYDDRPVARPDAEQRIRAQHAERIRRTAPAAPCRFLLYSLLVPPPNRDRANRSSTRGGSAA